MATVLMRRRSVGDASIGVTRDPKLDDRMSAAFTVTDTTGKRYTIDLTLDDVRNLHADLAQLLGASQAQVSHWWARLADGRDGRPRAKVTTRAGGR
jgi:hypothetical protein